MSTLKIRQITKKDQQIIFASGVVIDISVENIFEVGMYLDNRKVGRMKFNALSSLNNLELSPLYHLDELSIQPKIKEYSEDLEKVSVNLFKEYTNGRIRLPQTLEITSFDKPIVPGAG